MSGGGQKSSISALIQATGRSIGIPDEMQIPGEGDNKYRCSVFLYDGEGEMLDPENNEILIRVLQDDGTVVDETYKTSSLAAKLDNPTDTTTFPVASGWRALERLGAGRYDGFQKIQNTDSEEVLSFEIGYESDSNVIYAVQNVNVINATIQPTSRSIAIPEEMQIPDEGSNKYRCSVFLYDGEGEMLDPENNEILIRVLQDDGTPVTSDTFKTSSLAANLDNPTDTTTFPTADGWRALERLSAGRFDAFQRVQFGDEPEILSFEIGYESGGNVIYAVQNVTIIKEFDSRIATTTIDLHQSADTYDLLQSDADVIIKSISIRLPNVDVSDDSAITSISVVNDHVTATTFIDTTQGAKANLTAEAELTWEGFSLLRSGKKIQLIIAGGSADAETVCDVTTEYACPGEDGNLS